MNQSLILTLLVSSAIAMAGAAVGVRVSGASDIARRIVPLSGAALLLISLIWVLPELFQTFGWPLGPALMLAGFGLIYVVDRYVYAICPACAHTHDHDACSTRLHGFATPLILAALIHSSFDGWTLAIGNEAGKGVGLAASVLVHKIPESLAYGVILRAALRSNSQALVWALIAQAATLAGAVMAIELAPVLGSQWMGVLLAMGGGMFLYLGFHAVHGEWKRRRVAERALRNASGIHP